MAIKKMSLWRWMFIYLLFQSSLASMFTGTFSTVISYSDEVIAVILLALIVINVEKLISYEKIILVLLLIFEIIGIISGLLTDFQSNIYMFVDAFVCSKFIIYFIAARITTNGIVSRSSIWKLNDFCKITAVVFFALLMHDLFFTPFFPKYDFRYFTYSIQLFFGHPEGLSRVCFLLVMVLAYNMNRYKYNYIYIALLTIVMFFTFRTKALCAIFVFYLLYFYFIKMKFRNKMFIFSLGIVGVTALGYDTFVSYYSHSEYARTKLTTDGFKLANKYFPLGTGFGTFGSNIAAQHYSKIYEKLGYLNVWGMGKEGQFLSDTFWPILMAQTGWLGTIVFVFIIVVLFMYLIKKARNNKLFFVIGSCILGYDLISSLGASAFFHPSAMSAYILLGLLFSINENERKELYYGQKQE